MEIRYSAEIAGVEPIYAPKAHVSAYASLHAWTLLLSRPQEALRAPPLVDAEASRKARPQDARALRLALSESIQANVNYGPEWDVAYKALVLYTGSLAGTLETGGVLRTGTSWVASIFPARPVALTTGMASQDYARLKILDAALTEELATPIGKAAWLDRLLVAPALSPWSKASVSHWTLALLDIWQSYALAPQVRNRDPAHVANITQLAYRCVLAIDDLLDASLPDEPLLWRQLARQVASRIEYVGMKPRPDLPIIESFPVNVPALRVWSEDRLDPSGWKTQVCLFIDAIITNQAAPLLSSPAARGLALSRLAHDARHLPADQKSFALNSFVRLGAFFKSKFGAAIEAEAVQAGMNAVTPLAKASGARRSHRL